MSEGVIFDDLLRFERALAVLPERVTQAVMRDVAKMAEREMLRRYRRTTQTWRHKPTFVAVREFTPNSYGVIVGTDDPVYGYVDRGTRPHIIEPKGPGYPLRFRSGYNAKTTPGVLGSQNGGAFGNSVHAWRVHHPGTQARKFTEMIQNEIGPMALDFVLKGIRTAMDREFKVIGRRG